MAGSTVRYLNNIYSSIALFIKSTPKGVNVTALLPLYTVKGSAPILIPPVIIAGARH